MCILCETKIYQNIYGTSGHDIVYGTGSYAKVYLGSGNDYISVVGENNIFLGQMGNDRLYSEGNTNTLNGGSGNDLIQIKGDSGKLLGGSGHDNEKAFGNSNKLLGATGDDRLFAKGDNNKLYGQDGNDRLIVRGDDNHLFGEGGNDIFNARGNANTLDGGNGLDKLIVRGNDSFSFGGDGKDKLYSFGNNNQLDGGLANDFMKATGNTNELLGQKGNDRLYTIGDNNKLTGGNGHDTLLTKGSNNVLKGNAGNDKLYSLDGGNNTLLGHGGNDRLVSHDGNDTLTGGRGDDVISAGAGNDTANYVARHNVNSTKDLYNGGSGTDILNIKLEYSEATNLAQQFSYNSVTDYLSAMQSSFNAHTSDWFDFNGFGLKLFAKNFETLNVNVSGSPFNANNDSISVNENDVSSPFNVITNDSNPNNDSLSITKVNNQDITSGQSITLSSGARLTLNNDGTFSYDTNGAFNHVATGQQQVDSFTYTITNGGLNSTATVNVTINGVNDGPSANHDSFSMDENDRLSGNLFNNNGNGADSDIDGDVFTVTHVNGQSISNNNVVTLNSGAELTINNDGSFSFNPNGQYDHLNQGETASEAFSYQITDAHGATSTANATITINGLDQNAIPTISVSDASITEGNNGQNTFLTFDVTLSNASSNPVTVDFTTSGGTASAIINADFNNKNGTLTFNAGETSKTISIKVLGDKADEANETVHLNLSNADGATIDDGNAIGTIIDNDSAQSGSLAVPILNSKAGAAKVIYLDFNGASVSGTAWNQYNNGQTINAPAFDSNGNASSFSNAELSQINEIWQRVQEDFLPFNVNVTTDLSVYNATSANQRLKTVITDDNSWYGNAGGVAYVNVWGQSNDNYQPAWVFSNMLGKGGSNFAKNVAEAVSHELGHNLGLYHDGSSSTSYYQGHGSGETGWASIMGVGYYKELTQWSKGEYSGANNQQDDLSYLSSRLGYRADDHGDNALNASLIHMGQGLAAEGIIERNTDVDVFKFVGQGAVNLNINNLSKGANLDILAVLKDANGNVLATSNPSNDTDAAISVNLNVQQEVYLEVSGTGMGSPSTGYSDYGSLGYYSVELA